MKAHLTRRIPMRVAMGVVLAMLALGFLGVVGVRFLVVGTASADPSCDIWHPAPNPGHSYDQIGLLEGTWPALDADEVDGLHAAEIAAAAGGACYTNWNSDSCGSGYTAVETGVWTVFGIAGGTGGIGGVICAGEKSILYYTGLHAIANTKANTGHMIDHEPCAICCK